MFHSNKFSKTTALAHGVAIAALVSGLSITSSQAHATTTDVPQISINSGNYNLSSDAGVAALYSRIAKAAHDVCDAYDGPSLSQRSRVQKCVNVAIKDAIENAGIAPLTAYYVAKKGNAAADARLIAGR